MGHHFPRTRWITRGEPSPSITWGEYVTALSEASNPGGHLRGDVDLRRPPAAGPVNEPDETDTLGPRTHARRRPEDTTAHRRLGLSHLARGRLGPAAGHLEIALRLVRRRAPRAVGLTDALERECEAALLRLVLMQLYMRLGNRARAQALAREAHAVL